jgi:hypothetical protein
MLQNIWKYCEGMKVCQMAGCTRRSRRKRIGKWEPEGTFRARSDAKEGLSLSLCACGTVYVLVWGHYHVVPPQYNDSALYFNLF